MASSKIDVTVDGGEPGSIVVQGFREGPDGEPYVFLGLLAEAALVGSSAVMSVEDANILGEYLRQNAEFAQTVREMGE